MATQTQTGTTGTEAANYGPLRMVLEKFRGEKGTIIPILQETQDAYGYLPSWALEEIAAATGTPLAQIYGVATFYAQFRLHPIGKHLVRVCCGTACHVAGAEKIADSLCQNLDVDAGRDDRRTAVHPRDRGLPGVLLPGPGHDDRRRDLRPAGRQVGPQDRRRAEEKLPVPIIAEVPLVTASP